MCKSLCVWKQSQNLTLQKTSLNSGQNKEVREEGGKHKKREKHWARIDGDFWWEGLLKS